MINQIGKLTPRPIKRLIFTTCRKIMKAFWENAEARIPIYELKQEHIQNSKLIISREEMLDMLPKNGVVAEIGVDQGKFSEKILEINQPRKLHLVDMWGTKRYSQTKRQGVENKFKDKIKDKSIEINLGLSTEVVDSFADDYFDWIYIDTNHSYKTTYEELEKYSSKVKKGGVIAGHDYIIGNWNGMVRYGVIEAVYEFCIKYNWQILYLTAENQENPSFAIKRMSDS